jgi:hypothetical protein
MRILFFVISIFFVAVNSFALDLDDGISIDDSIEDYHELGKMEKI